MFPFFARWGKFHTLPSQVFPYVILSHLLEAIGFWRQFSAFGANLEATGRLRGVFTVFEVLSHLFLYTFLTPFFVFPERVNPISMGLEVWATVKVLQVVYKLGCWTVKLSVPVCCRDVYSLWSKS